MKNFEKYIDKIANYMCLSDALGENTYCSQCKFRNSAYSCDNEKVKQWLLAEYVEPITHDEYVILKNLPSWCKWIAKDKNTKVCTVYEIKPKKISVFWNCDGMKYKLDMFNHLFQFIKYEDEEPYEIAKLIDDYEKENEDE